MDGSALIACLSALAGVAAAAFAASACLSAKRALLHQTLVDIQNDYRSAEMLFAVRTLWQFYRQHGKGRFVDEYEKMRLGEEEWVLAQEKHKRIEYERATLHFQRRMVSHFYQHLATLYVNKVVHQEKCFSAPGHTTT